MEPMVVLGLFGVRISPAQGLFVLSALCQASSAIIALVLTANILFTQLQTYSLPVRYLVVWDRSTKLTFGMLAASAVFPAVLILFAYYRASDIAVGLFGSTIIVLGYYVRTRPKSVTLDRFFNEMVWRRTLREDSVAELYDMCLSALDKSDVDTFRKACMLLFSIEEPSDAVYEFWNNVVERVQDEPQAVTPLAEAIYVCGSPIAVTHVIPAASKASTGPGAINPLFSSALAEQSPHYLTRLLLLSAASGATGRGLVRQEVVENLLLLVLDLLTACESGAARQASVSEATIPTLLGYLDEADSDILLAVMRGNAVYHYLMFCLPGAERFGGAQRRDEIEAARHAAWDRIVAHIYYDHGWDKRPELELALWREAGPEPEIVRGADRIREIIGERGEDGLRCEWHPPRKTRLRSWLPIKR